MLLTSFLPRDASELLTGMWARCHIITGWLEAVGCALHMPPLHTADPDSLQRAAWARFLSGLEPYTQDRRRPMRLLQRVLVRLHAVEKPQHTLLTSLVRRLRRLAVSASESAPLSDQQRETLECPSMMLWNRG
jgi:hypothetical protein